MPPTLGWTWACLLPSKSARRWLLQHHGRFTKAVLFMGTIMYTADFVPIFTKGDAIGLGRRERGFRTCVPLWFSVQIHQFYTICKILFLNEHILFYHFPAPHYRCMIHSDKCCKGSSLEIENIKRKSLDGWRVKAIQIDSDSGCGTSVIEKRSPFTLQRSPSQQQSMPTVKKSSGPLCGLGHLC